MPDRLAMMRSMKVPSIHSQDWDILEELIERYGVDELVRAVRVRQMIDVLDPKDTPEDAHQDPEAPQPD